MTGLRKWVSKLLSNQNGGDQSSTDESAKNDATEDSGNGRSGVEANGRGHERELREFVYLDRDSVVSLLASIEGAIKQERTEQIGSQSTERVAGGINASISGVGAKVEGEQVEMGESSSEVVHNYAIQSLFNQLDQHRRQDKDIGLINSGEESEVKASEEIRGKVLRANVKLETHYIYRFYKVMSNIQENIPEAIDPEDENVLELIESMFGAEIPVSGRVLGHQVKHGKIQPGEPETSDGEPLYIVGQLNALKLWQDVPDALFDGEEYTVFCRVKETYDEDSWHPLTLAQKIETVSPPMANVLTKFMERAAALAKEEASEQSTNSFDIDNWTNKLTEFDKIAGVDGSGDDTHQKFMNECIIEKGNNMLPPFDRSEQIQLYKEYVSYLRDQGISISNEDQAEATNDMVFDTHVSMNNKKHVIDVDALQIESQIVAIYW